MKYPPILKVQWGSLKLPFPSPSPPFNFLSEINGENLWKIINNISIYIK